MCHAFVAAFEAWCVKGAAKSGPTKGHEFANVFFDKLREQSPDLAGSVTREAPMLMAKGAEAGSWTSVGMLKDLAKVGPGGGGAAWLSGKVLTGKTLLTGADTVAATWGKSFRWGCNKDLGRLAGGDYRMKYPDGVMKNGQVMEIKAPGDTWGKGQYEAYNDESMRKTGKPPLVMSCHSCGADCDDSKRCPR